MDSVYCLNLLDLRFLLVLAKSMNQMISLLHYQRSFISISRDISRFKLNNSNFRLDSQLIQML